MIDSMLPMKRCATCGKVRRDHVTAVGRILCVGGGEYSPVTINWAEFQRAEMERAEAIYDRCPNIERASGLPVPFEDAMPMSRQRCIDQAKVDYWTRRREDER